MKDRLDLEMALKAHKRVIENAGGSLAAYLVKYGETRGQAIWNSDQNVLKRLERELKEVK